MNINETCASCGKPLWIPTVLDDGKTYYKPEPFIMYLLLKYCVECGEKQNPIVYEYPVIKNKKGSTITQVTRRDGFKETYLTCEICRKAPCKHMYQENSGNWKVRNAEHPVSNSDPID